MKALVIMLLSIILFSSMSFAQEVSLEKAYKLYFSGKQDTAINMMEEYIKDNPDPAVYYFLGYAYYEKKQMSKAEKYFQEAFARKPFYSPLTSENK